jgi:hypothetical protein
LTSVSQSLKLFFSELGASHEVRQSNALKTCKVLFIKVPNYEKVSLYVSKNKSVKSNCQVEEYEGKITQLNCAISIAIAKLQFFLQFFHVKIALSSTRKNIKIISKDSNPNL